jgi:tetratricopeptide (TPR) repeat protein
MRPTTLAPLLLAALLGGRPAPAQESRPDGTALRSDGDRALSRGDAAAALAAFDAALAADGSLASRLGRARALLALDRVNDALDELDLAEKEVPGSPETTYLFARAFLAKGEKMSAPRPSGSRSLPFEDAARRDCFEEASRRLTSLLEGSSRPAEAASLLARARLALGDFDGAEAALARAKEADPKYPGLARQRGDVAFLRYLFLRNQEEGTPGDREKFVRAARLAYEEAMRVDPKDAASAKSLGDLHLWREKPEEAAGAYAEALARDPSVLDLSALSSRLSEPLARKTVEQAAARYDASHPKDAGSATLWWYAGFHQFKAGDMKEARASFAKALAKNPAFTNTHYYAGRAAYAEKDYEAAETSFVALARAGFPGFGEILKGSGQLAADHDIVAFLANRAVQAGREAEACDLFRGLAEVYPDNADHWNNAAFFARNSGRPEEAYAYYLRALEIRPDDPQLLNAAAIVLDYNLGRDLEEAKRLYRRAIECAERVLKNRDASERAKEEARTAKGDAENNLRRHDRRTERPRR